MVFATKVKSKGLKIIKNVDSNSEIKTNLITIFENCLFLKMSLLKNCISVKSKCNVACDFLCFSFIKKQPKLWPIGNIDLPGSPYSLHGYSGRLGARLTSIKKAN